MATNDTERYVRITLLTFEGGNWICKKILNREVVNGFKTLDTLLLQNQSRLNPKQRRHGITQKQYDLLFPKSRADTDVDEWDLSLLVKVILVLFDTVLPAQDKDDMHEILRIRNEVVCHASQPSLQQQEFAVHWFTLTTSVTNLASNFDDATKLYASDLLQKLSRGPLDIQSSLDRLAKLCRNDELMENALASLRGLEERLEEIATGVSTTNKKLEQLDKINDVLAGVREILRIQELDGRGLCRIEIPMLNSTVCLSGKKDDVVKLAENIILKVLRSAIQKVDDPNDDKVVKFAVCQFLSDIEDKDAVVESAESGSIMLRIRCKSLPGLNNMLNMLRSDGRCRLPVIEVALYASLWEEVKVELVLPEETIDTLKTLIVQVQISINYDAFVMSVDSDQDALKKLITIAEDMHGLKLFVPKTELLPGIGQLDAWTYMIEKRCIKLVALISLDFMRSEQSQFLVRFATARGLAEGRRKIIPIKLDDSGLPWPLNSLICFDTRRCNWNVLIKAIRKPEGMEGSRVSSTSAHVDARSGRKSYRGTRTDWDDDVD